MYLISLCRVSHTWRMYLHTCRVPGPRVHVSPVHAVRGPHQVAPPHRHGVPAGLGDARRLGRVVRVVEQLTNHSSALQLHQSGLTWPRM